MLSKFVAVILLWAQVAAQFQFGFYRKVRLGSTLHVNCEVDKGWKTLVWYKLDTNWRLQRIALYMSTSGLSLKDNHYSVETYDTGSTLTVPDVTWEDTGTYYCGINKNTDYMDFSAGTVVVVEGESRSMQAVVQSPDYIRVQPGDSVTLSCSFNSNLCPKETRSITWVKNGSASSMASWITGITSTTCEKRDTGETSCVSNLPLTWKDISSAEDETYFCVVTVCGRRLLGTGTRIKHGNDPQGLSPAGAVLIVVCLAFAVTVLALVRLMRTYKKQTTEVERGSRGPPEDYQAADIITYAQVSTRPRTGPIQAPADQPLYSEVGPVQAPADQPLYSEVRTSRPK